MNLRNEYIHTCSIYAGYRIGIGDGDTSPFILRASGPEVSFLREPLTALGPSEIRTYAEHLTDRLGKFLDGTNWQVAWALLREQQGHLPVNPEPEYSQIADASPEKIHSLTVILNERYIGEGSRWLREQKEKERKV